MSTFSESQVRRGGDPVNSGRFSAKTHEEQASATDTLTPMYVPSLIDTATEPVLVDTDDFGAVPVASRDLFARVQLSGLDYVELVDDFGPDSHDEIAATVLADSRTGRYVRESGARRPYPGWADRREVELAREATNDPHGDSALTLVRDPHYGTITTGQRAVYNRFGVSPQQHEQLLQRYGHTSGDLIITQVERDSASGVYEPDSGDRAHQATAWNPS